jgi:hypothetical protein
VFRFIPTGITLDIFVLWRINASDARELMQRLSCFRDLVFRDRMTTGLSGEIIENIAFDNSDFCSDIPRFYPGYLESKSDLG